VTNQLDQGAVFINLGGRTLSFKRGACPAQEFKSTSSFNEEEHQSKFIFKRLTNEARY
jgi:hypothetical protein